MGFVSLHCQYKNIFLQNNNKKTTFYFYFQVLSLSQAIKLPTFLTEATCQWCQASAPDLSLLNYQRFFEGLDTNVLNLFQAQFLMEFIVISPGYSCCIKRAGATVHLVAWLDSTTECICSPCCTGSDRAIFKSGLSFTSAECSFFSLEWIKFNNIRSKCLVFSLEWINFNNIRSQCAVFIWTKNKICTE